MIRLKNAEEIELMRESAHLVGRTLAEVAKYIKAGTKTATLDAVAEEYIRDAGGEPAFKGYRVGNRIFPASLCISVNDEVVHGIPGPVELEDGDILSIDCGVRRNGYYGDSAYTFVVGEISSEERRLLQVTYEALMLGVEAAIAGNRIGDISFAVQGHCERNGFGVVRDLVGHGIGRKLHEDPQVPNFGRRGTGRKLKEGLTICIEPMVNQGTADVTVDTDGWTIRAADGLPSAHYEHMVVVQRGRPLILSTFDYIEDVIEAPYREEVFDGETTGH